MAHTELTFVPGDNYSLQRFGGGDKRRLKSYLLMLAAFLEGKPFNTKRSYRCGIRQFFDLFEWICPEEVTPAHAAAFKKWLLEHHGVQESTAYYRISAVSSFFDYLCNPPDATSQPLINHNPFKQLNRSDIQPTPYARAHAMEWETLNAIIDALPSDPLGLRDKAILLFFAFTGRRRAEVAGIKIKDLRLKERPRTYSVRVKGGRIQRFELPEVCYDAIRAYWVASNRLKTLSRESAVFAPMRNHLNEHLDPDGHLTERNMNYILKRAADRAEVELEPEQSIHAIRHMSARDLDQIGARLQDIQAFLGHANPNTTQIYLKQLGGPPPSYEKDLLRLRKKASDLGRRAAEEEG